MKTLCGIPNGSESGSTLTVTMVTLGLITSLLGSYLTLLSGANKSSARSICWNRCIPVLEAGIEEAMGNLNKNGASSLTSDGWSLSAGYYTKRLSLDWSDAYCLTKISTTSPPTIESEGFVLSPLSSTVYIARKVRVTTQIDGLFVKGLVAKGQIDLKGNNVRVDSFDSSDPTASSGGAYDPSKFRQNGDVATDSRLINSLSVGNADIYGDVSTGPGGTIAVGAQGFVTGTIADDMNVSFPDVSIPYTTGATPIGGTVGGTSYTYVLSSGNYLMNGDLSMSGNNQRILVTGNVALYVKGSISIAGSAYIRIANGGKLILYVGGASASVGGNGVVNLNTDASKFFYYGLPSNTSVSFSGNAAFTGVIYAPSAALSLGGGGNNTYDFVGASISSTVTMNGHYNFHYDENLARVGPTRGFVITSWNEL